MSSSLRFKKRSGSIHGSSNRRPSSPFRNSAVNSIFAPGSGSGADSAGVPPYNLSSSQAIPNNNTSSFNLQNIVRRKSIGSAPSDDLPILASTLDDQAAELDKRAEFIKGLQRNIEGLSVVCRKDRSRVLQLEAEMNTKNELISRLEASMTMKQQELDQSAPAPAPARVLTARSPPPSTRPTEAQKQLLEQLERERWDALKRVEDLQANSKRLVAQINEQQSGESRLRKQLEAISTQSKSLLARNRALEAGAAEAEGAVAELAGVRAQLAAATSQGGVAQEGLAKARAAIAELQRQVKAGAQREAAGVQAAELARKQAFEAEAARRLAEAQALHQSELEEMQRQVDRLLQRVQEQEAAHTTALAAAASERAAAVASANHSAEQSHAAAVEGLERRLRESHALNEQMQGAVARSSAEATAASAAVAALQDKLERARSDNSQLAADRRRFSSSADETVEALARARAGHDTALEILMREKRELQGELQLVSAQGERDRRANQIAQDKAEKQVEELTVALGAVRGSTAVLEAEGANARQEVAELRRQLSDGRKAALMDLNQRGQEVDALTAALNKQQAKNEELSCALRAVPRSSAEVMALLRDVEGEMKTAVDKLVTADEASEAAYTCLSCMRLFDQPVSCIPCGHTYCRGCVEATRGAQDINGTVAEEPFCQECGVEHRVEYFVENHLIANLASKFTYRHQALLSLKRMAARLCSDRLAAVDAAVSSEGGGSGPSVANGGSSSRGRRNSGGGGGEGGGVRPVPPLSSSSATASAQSQPRHRIFSASTALESPRQLLAAGGEEKGSTTSATYSSNSSSSSGGGGSVVEAVAVGDRGGGGGANARARAALAASRRGRPRASGAAGTGGGGTAVVAADIATTTTATAAAVTSGGGGGVSAASGRDGGSTSSRRRRREAEGLVASGVGSASSSIRRDSL